MNLEDFKKSIDENNTLKPSTQQMVQVKKNIILSYVCDQAGCGHIRNVFPMTYINAFSRNFEITPIITPVYLWQDDILMRTKTIFFQRTMAPEMVGAVAKYKELQPKYGYKMVYDIDDFIWGHNELQGGDKENGVPSYNFGWRGITEHVKAASVEIMKMMDGITVTSEFLKYWINEVEGVNVPVTVLPNAVPMYFYGNKRKPERKKPIEKPMVMYTGSPTHYNNQEHKLGDFENKFTDFIIKNVKNGKMNMTFLAELPWMFEEIRNKVNIIPWKNSYQYHLGLKSVKADFAIGPLVPNNFNYSKSYIKYQEMCAEGIPFIGTTFSNKKPSPYDISILKVQDTCSVEDIEKLIFGLSSDFNQYNKIVKEQYEWLDKSGGYLESPKYLQSLLDNYF